MEIRNKLKELRKEYKKTQTQLAEVLNLSRTGYANWEQGLAEPNIEQIKTIAKYYKITIDDLLDFDCYQYNFEYQHADTKLIHREKNNNK
jgi:transcriptional regulator with XRE-family HTH domain